MIRSSPRGRHQPMAKQQMTGQRDQGMMEQVRIADVKEYGVHRYFAAPVLTVHDVAAVPPTDQYVAVHCERSGQGRRSVTAGAATPGPTRRLPSPAPRDPARRHPPPPRRALPRTTPPSRSAPPPAHRPPGPRSRPRSPASPSPKQKPPPPVLHHLPPGVMKPIPAHDPRTGGPGSRAPPWASPPPLPLTSADHPPRCSRHPQISGTLPFSRGSS